MKAELRRLAEGRYSLEGEVTVDTVPDLWPQIQQAAAQPGMARLSCKGVTQADSAAVAVVIEWMRLLHRRGDTLMVEDLPKAMRVVIEISDLEDVFHIEAA